MKRTALWAAILISILGVALAADSQPPHPDEMLDAPGGRPVAILLPGAARRVVEERDGYIKVVVEGWIRSDTASKDLPRNANPGSEPSPTSAASPAEAIASTSAPAKAGPSLDGRVEIHIASGEVRYGAGARVVALGNVAALEKRRASLAADYFAAAGRLKEQIAGLEEQKKQALNSSDNLTQAAQNLDRAKSQAAQKNRELDELQQQYAAKGEALRMEFKVAEAVADPGGAYHLEGLAPGDYRVWATFSDGAANFRWYLPAILLQGKATQLDLSASKPGNDPFLQLP